MVLRTKDIDTFLRYEEELNKGNEKGDCDILIQKSRINSCEKEE